MQPITPFSETQPIHRRHPKSNRRMHLKSSSKTHRGLKWLGGCLLLSSTCCLLSIILFCLFYFSPKTNILLLGIDRTPEGSLAGRSDTIVLFSINPAAHYIGMLSIPRDLWVSIPGHGENRINTAHFYAEAESPGTGPAATAQVIRQNFGVEAPYYLRIRFDGLTDLIDTMGGVDIDLPYATAGYTPGRHHLNGVEALAFARDRKGTDDFFRMQQGQLLIKAIINQVLFPSTWSRILSVPGIFDNFVDTNIPIYLFPGITFGFLLIGPQNVDSQTISRDMIQPTITEGGADVLLPKWDKIRPMILEIFGP